MECDGRVIRQYASGQYRRAHWIVFQGAAFGGLFGLIVGYIALGPWLSAPMGALIGMLAFGVRGYLCGHRRT